MYYFVDTSVLLRAILDSSISAQNWFSQVAFPDKLIGSEMLALDTRRATLNFEVVTGDDSRRKLAETYLSKFSLREIDPGIMRRAENIRFQLRAGDAIHLATALDFGADNLVFVTHDAQQATAAKALGMQVQDPVTDDPNRPPTIIRGLQ